MFDRSVWIALFFLGCYHGLNPAMGWLFAVALGLQERSTAAVLRAVAPIVIGHIVSVAAVVALAASAVALFPHAIVRTVAAAILLGFGAYRLIRARHPRWVGMRVGFWGLAFWGFLMATAHGAGLMLLPLVLTAPAFAQPMAMPMPHPDLLHDRWLTGLLMIGVHTLGYALTTIAIAVVVYAKFGVSFLRQAWFNVDLVWGIALVVAGIVTLLT
jgi:hypothetical protein